MIPKAFILHFPLPPCVEQSFMFATEKPAGQTICHPEMTKGHSMDYNPVFPFLHRSRPPAKHQLLFILISVCPPLRIIMQPFTPLSTITCGSSIIRRRGTSYPDCSSPWQAQQQRHYSNIHASIVYHSGSRGRSSQQLPTSYNIPTPCNELKVPLPVPTTAWLPSPCLQLTPPGTTKLEPDKSNDSIDHDVPHTLRPVG